MRFTILDCYTDEPAGLGVPPYIGTYPRYIAGAIIAEKDEVFYLTIDDLRSLDGHKKDRFKTDIKTKNKSVNFENINNILNSSDYIIIVAGVHTPGKYLSAVPGTTKEVLTLFNKHNITNKTILTGPAVYGSGLYGGKIARDIETDTKNFDLIIPDLEYKFKELKQNNFSCDVDTDLSFEKLSNIAQLGASIVKSHPDYSDFMIAEIETSKGCPRSPGCSFCTEPLKYHGMAKREIKDIVEEVRALHSNGVKNFRLGKQSCFYSFGKNEDIAKLLKNVRQYAEILHIDNVNPAAVDEEKTKTIVKYCTEGNIAAFGVESFDKEVIQKNNLNSDPKTTLNAVRIINKYGRERGENGMPKFLPGINILFGLNGETKNTNQENMFYFKKILDEGLLLRRINIREVVVFKGTKIFEECKDKYLHKNKKYYWKWREQIRQEIDSPLLNKLVPIGTVIKRLRAEIHDGNTTFLRQIGSYPLIVGVKERLELNKFYDVKVTGHMLRSITGELLK